MAKVLIVEDELALNEAYTMILEREKYDVVRAWNGEEAIALIGTEKPDLMLLDLRMPKMSGIEVLEKLSKENPHPDMKIIVFSNYDVQSEIDHAYELGADRYMLKAWASPKELARLVADTLEENDSVENKA